MRRRTASEAVLASRRPSPSWLHPHLRAHPERKVLLAPEDAARPATGQAAQDISHPDQRRRVEGAAPQRRFAAAEEADEHARRQGFLGRLLPIIAEQIRGDGFDAALAATSMLVKTL